MSRSWIRASTPFLGAALGILALAAAAPIAVAKPPRIGGCRVFPAFNGADTAPSAANQSAWNQNVAKAPVDPRSSAYINRITALGGNQFLHPDFGGNGRYGIPYTTVGSNQRRVQVRVTAYPGQSDFGRAPIPPDAPVENGSDRHVLVVQREHCDLFEMFGAHYLGGHGHRWKAASTAQFDLRSTKLRHEGWTSADAAGLPILPGLVRYSEVKHGHVRHAIRVTFEQTRRAYIHPATHYASSDCNVNLPPMGLRLRLKASYDLSRFSGQALVIARALKQYGIINADNGSNWYIGGASDTGWNDSNLNRLKSIPGRAFQVVKSAASPTVASDCP